MTISKNLLAFGFAFKKVLGDLTESVVCLIRILIESKWRPNPISAGEKRDTYVLGTGPSLFADIKIFNLINRSEINIICVNDFYKSKYFKILCPDHYVIADPDYWNDSLFDSVSKGMVEAASSVTGNIYFWLPLKAKESMLDIELRRANSAVIYYNTTPLSGISYVKLACFRKKLAMPRPQNVLVAAISIGIWMGSKKINLLGADHDWHKDISVSMHSKLQIRNNHAYDGDECFTPFYKPSKGSANESRMVFTVSEIFQAWATVHQSYECLQMLSKRCGVKILNRSSNSFIDAFERII